MKYHGMSSNLGDLLETKLGGGGLAGVVIVRSACAHKVDAGCSAC